MRIFANITRSLFRKARPIDLKTSLVIRIALVAISCFVLVTVATLWDSDRETRAKAAHLANLVAKQLSLQVWRINAGFDLSNRYPDWDTLLDSNSGLGQCVRLEDQQGAVIRSDCVGSLAVPDEAPHWFSALRSYVSSAPATRSTVSYKGRDYGTVIVSSGPKVIASRAWNDVKHLLALTALTILALSVLVYVAIARALAPTKEMISGLNRLSSGDFSHRLPHFRLAELERISEVANELGEKIATTLSERAELTRRLMNAQEEERSYLARELHDELGQNLTAIVALAASLEKSAERSAPELGAEARRLSQITMGTMESLRATLGHLRPADPDKFGLRASLEQLVDVCRASHGRTARFELDIAEGIPPLSDTAAIHVFRIAQEGLTNAIKHADAKTVRLILAPVTLATANSRRTPGIRLTIVDDGKGRALGGKAATSGMGGKAATSGMGLLNMRERVAALGGSLTLADRPGAGFAVSIVVPVAPADLPQDRPAP
jgi:two-component system sensor histidine kinase UhpB